MRKWYLTPILLIFLCLGCAKDSQNAGYLFKELSADKTGIDFKNNLTEDVNHSIINYIYYYNGAGVAAGDVNNDGLSDLYFVSNQGKNKLYLNKGNLQFEDISENANIGGASSWNTGATMIDINNDGYLDIYVCAVSGLLDFKGHNELFVNNGDGTFTEKAKEYGLDFKGYSTQSYFFDYDKDNDLDVYIVNHAVHTTSTHGPASARNKRMPLVGDVLLQNNNGKFTDVSNSANIYGGVNGYGLSASIADYNNDGWDDIYVCNDFHEDDYYYINNQDGTFSEKLSESFSTISRFSMGSDAADLNGDGYQDIVTLDMLPSDEKVLKESEGDDAMFNQQERLRKLGYKDQYSRNMLQINNSGDYFYEAAFLNGIADTDWSWAPLVADFDNDGHQDLFISNGILRRPNDLDFKKYVASTFKTKGVKRGLAWLYKSINEMPSGKVSNEIFKGNSKKLANKTGTWIEKKPSLSNGAIYLDLDQDGDLDLVTNNLNDYPSILENTTNNTKNHIAIKLDYVPGNKEGIGSKVMIYNNGKIQLKQLFKSRGFLSSIDNQLHFGLDTISSIDSLKIIWPNNTYQKIIAPEINKSIVIRYNEDNPNYGYDLNNENQKYTIEKELIHFKHIEDNYNDFNHERLIPYKVSTLGPAMAIGDVDNNGFDDVFIGNGSGEKAALFLNNGTNFSKAIDVGVENDALFEDNDAQFFDADNDGDLDLYVASGINSLRNKNYEVDRLYINNNGILKRSTDQIPANNFNTSTIAAYDYDNDGDEDLFVGNLSDPNNYGLNAPSYILVNDGNGNFTKDPDFTLFSKVSSATWQDINSDGIKDLLVSAEWDTPKLYMNTKGSLKPIDSPKNLNGLWQAITSYDIDGDGDKDILLGNWGLNTKLNPNPKAPLRMYHSDFDANGRYETILAYAVNNKYYPLNSKDELASQMNVVNKRFVNHKTFAMQPIETVLTKYGVDNATLYEVHTLASGYIENNNGNFDQFIKFPQDFQLAPINSFSKINIDNKEKILLSGNSLKVNTYHGAYKALKGLVVNTLKDYKPVSKIGLHPFNGQIKKTATIKMKEDNVLLVLSNNDSLKVYTSKK
ncbi:VCBS repeat-containing protein [Flavobacteriaceae bacterium S356]|uniref:VCBS repeat-containing protein n=1 Tax=Asprobacillus argus TaxID=3076534 RepID=A0ABU3LGK8_9FLAO|nr:VCBS repeat-containing protein [Flavobacteriaceae bacterium S356]